AYKDGYRHAGGARLPNQQRCDFRLSGGKCGKLASYVSVDGKHHHCAEHASASDRSIYDRALPRRNPRRRNQDDSASETTQAVELFQTFHGKDPSGVIEKQVSAAMRLEYTALGDLDYLIVKPEGAGAVRIDFGGDGVKLASAPGGTQLYLIGGKQTLDDACLSKFTDDTSKDLFDLGEAHEVQYIAKKAPNFDTVKYYHKFGEESKSSEMPRAFYDALRKQIFLAGGEYHVDAPGIIN
ncbi:MAG: hypothetical protein ACREH9_01815, partial [Pseudomonadota bacterium]